MPTALSNGCSRITLSASPEATDKLVRFTDYQDIKYRSRTVFSFHQPETLRALLHQPDTLRNNLKNIPPLTPQAFANARSTP